ncbi:hypothetical protein J6590_080192 [Homalodisca vitripennis]|nr:hypothetical protein J6590_080192 [Homalodisca vitripennis]
MHNTVASWTPKGGSSFIANNTLPDLDPRKTLQSMRFRSSVTSRSYNHRLFTGSKSVHDASNKTSPVHRLMLRKRQPVMFCPIVVSVSCLMSVNVITTDQSAF